MTHSIWITGAMDPEMAAIESVIRAADAGIVHLSGWPSGPFRGFVLEPGRSGDWRTAGCPYEGWHAFHERDVSHLEWRSATSGSVLRATKRRGGWELEFLPPPNNPGYRGEYFRLFDQHGTVENVKNEYVHGGGWV